jgi:hypothetical protein
MTYQKPPINRTITIGVAIPPVEISITPQKRRRKKIIKHPLAITVTICPNI